MGANTSSNSRIGKIELHDHSELVWSDSKAPDILLNLVYDQFGWANENGSSGNWTRERGEEYGEDVDGMERTMGELVVGTLTFVAITLMTIGGNILVILSVLTYRPLTRVQNYFLVSLAMADLAVAVFVTPFHVVKFIVGEWIFGLVFCQIWLTADILCCTASILNLCAIALDRYWAIHDPIAYASKRTLRLVLFMISVVWILSLLISVPPLIGWNDWTTDRLKSTCQLTTQREFVVYSASGSFFIPLLVMATVYAKIFLAARQRLRSKRRSIGGVSVGSAIDGPACDREHIRNNSRRSIRRRPTPVPSEAGHRSNFVKPKLSNSGGTLYSSSAEYSLFTAPSTTTTITYGDEKTAVLTRRNTGLLSTVEEQQSGVASSSGYDAPSLLRSSSPIRPVSPTSLHKRSTEKSPPVQGQNGVSTFFVLTSAEGKSYFKADLGRQEGSKPRRQQSLNHFVHRFSVRASIRNAKSPRRSEPNVLGLPRRQDSVRTSISSQVAVENYLKEKERISVTKEKKAAKTLAVIMGVFVLCWLPFFVTYLIKPFVPPHRWGMHPKVEEAITWLGYINSALNPVIYTIFNMDFRQAFRRFLCPFHSKRKKSAQSLPTKTATSGKTY